MASSLEYTFTCQVCFEEFEETGNHVPRLLPCTHTLCETCMGKLIRGDKLKCPECRQTHPATRGRKSFSQNKYILVNIKRSTSTNGQTISSKQPQADLCERHNRPRELFCTEDLCQKLICHLCLKNEHRNHDFEEAQQIIEEKRNMLVEHVGVVRNTLVSTKKRLLIAREDAKKNTIECTETIEKIRDENIRMIAEFSDKMITKVKNNYVDVNRKVYQETTKIDDNLGLLTDIKENSKAVKSVEDITQMIATVNMLAPKEERGMFKHFHYHGYKSLTVDDLQKITGSLDSKDAQVDSELLHLSKIHPLKSVQDASQLRLEGNCTLCINHFLKVIGCALHCSQKHKSPPNCSCFQLLIFCSQKNIQHRLGTCVSLMCNYWRESCCFCP